QVQRAVQVHARFLMHQHDVRAGIDKLRDVLVGIFDHQVDVERDARDFLDAGDDGDADRKVGDEMAVHYVAMEQRGPAIFNGADLFAQAREVRRQNGGGYFYLHNCDILSREERGKELAWEI